MSCVANGNHPTKVPLVEHPFGQRCYSRGNFCLVEIPDCKIICDRIIPVLLHEGEFVNLGVSWTVLQSGRLGQAVKNEPEDTTARSARYQIAPTRVPERAKALSRKGLDWQRDPISGTIENWCSFNKQAERE
jgi:hypothetical protein